MFSIPGPMGSVVLLVTAEVIVLERRCSNEYNSGEIVVGGRRMSGSSRSVARPDLDSLIRKEAVTSVSIYIYSLRNDNENDVSTRASLVLFFS